MAWETRRKGRFYYRKVRTSTGVRSVYVGNGLIAETEAEFAWQEIAARRAERQAAQEERKRFAEWERDIVLAQAALLGSARSALEAAGYHRHKYQWRKRRG